MTKSNTVQHQNMSKTRHHNGKKNNNTSSQMLLDHCYTFGLLLWPSNSEEVVLWRRALIDLLWPCPGSTTVRIWPNSQYKCAGVMSTPKCLLINAMHSVCCCSIPPWRKSSLEKGPSLTNYGPALDLPLGGFGPKVNTNERGLEYFIPTKFGENPSSDSVVKSDFVFPYIYIH